MVISFEENYFPICHDTTIICANFSAILSQSFRLYDTSLQLHISLIKASVLKPKTHFSLNSRLACCFPNQSILPFINLNFLNSGDKKRIPPEITGFSVISVGIFCTLTSNLINYFSNTFPNFKDFNPSIASIIPLILRSI